MGSVQVLYLVPTPLADLKPALHLEGIVNILRSLDCTVTNVGLMIKQGSQADTSGTSLAYSCILFYQYFKNKVSRSCKTDCA